MFIFPFVKTTGYFSGAGWDEGDRICGLSGNELRSQLLLGNYSE
jgi:hypothetical protein